MYENNDFALKICQDFEYLAGKRTNEEQHWQEIAERMDPASSKQFQAKHPNAMTGDKRNDKIFDSTAAIALGRFAAILDSLLTPRDQTWHRLKPSDPYLLKQRNVMLWFEEVNRLLLNYRYQSVANFASQNQQNYRSLGAYGTGCVFVDGLRTGRGLRYRNIHLSEIYFAENHQGIVDMAYRRFFMTLRQLEQKFGSKMPEHLKARAAVNPQEETEILHAVVPRENYDPTRKDSKGKPLASYYILKDGHVLLEEGGYDTFPYAISRYYQASGEIYGRSPAMDVLPAVKTLNEQKKTVLKQGHRAVDPVLLAHDDGILEGFSLKPGAINAGGVNAEGRALVQALPVGNIAIGKDMMDDERAVINDAFLVTIFQILVDNPQMSATEVVERTREKGILLAPTVGRQQTEYLGPMIEREIDIMSAQGLLPAMPGLLKEAAGEYRIEYDSPISRTQKAEEAAGFMRTLETAINVASVTQDMTILHHFNFDEALPEIAQIQGMPTRWMNSVDKIAELRQASQQQAQDEMMIQAAPAAAAMVKAQAVAKKTKGK